MPLTILTIEDTPEIPENLTEILHLTGYKTVSATDGLSGIDLAARIQPDLILCDILLPNIDGYEVMRQLRRGSSTRRIPLIYITSQADPIHVKRAFDLGASGYIIKPFSAEMLISQIERSLQFVASHDQSLSAERHLS